MSNIQSFDIQIFVNAFPPRKVITYNGTSQNTVKDMKRFLSRMYCIPTYRQNITFSKVLEDSTIVGEFNGCTFNLLLLTFAGPEKLIGKNVVSRMIEIDIDLPTILCRTIQIPAKPYWYIGGRAGLIDRIVELFNELDGLSLCLMMCGDRKISNDSDTRLGDIPNLVGNYIQFTPDQLITGMRHLIEVDNGLPVMRFDKRRSLATIVLAEIGSERTMPICMTKSSPYYGYLMCHGTNSQKDTFLTQPKLKLVSSDAATLVQEYKINLQFCVVCDKQTRLPTFPLKCKHRICSDCVPFYGKCNVPNCANK